MPCLLFAPPVGSTSEWGIIITPCAWCFKTNVPIEVHHIIPQAECKRIGKPELIYDTNNMVCLCRRCHFTVGHKNNWTNVFLGVTNVIKEGKK
jgi:5-methylcytosine-specific restriction endonuclease McrA